MLHNSQKDFLKRHIGPSDEDQNKMLKELNYKSLSIFSWSFSDGPMCLLIKSFCELCNISLMSPLQIYRILLYSLKYLAQMCL